MPKQKHQVGVTITTPSRFGSHKSMVVDASKHGVQLKDGEVLCEDDEGVYVTTIDRLDNNLADSNRWSRQ